MNLMKVDGYHAKIEYDEDTDQFWRSGFLWNKPR